MPVGVAHSSRTGHGSVAGGDQLGVSTGQLAKPQCVLQLYEGLVSPTFVQQALADVLSRGGLARSSHRRVQRTVVEACCFRPLPSQ